MGAGQRLVEMVVGVDEAGQDDVTRGVEDRVDRRGGLKTLPTSSTMRVPSTTRPRSATLGENRQRVLDPCAQRLLLESR